MYIYEHYKKHKNLCLILNDQITYNDKILYEFITKHNPHHKIHTQPTPVFQVLNTSNNVQFQNQLEDAHHRA